LSVMDLGRSVYPSSQFDFKEKWGDETYPIYQLYHIYHGRTPRTLVISQAINEENQYLLFRQVWAKLPESLVAWLGPIIRHHLPFG